MKSTMDTIKGFSMDLDFGVYLDSEMIMSLHGHESLSTLKVQQKSFIPSVEVSNELYF
mgnify:CR=1 FL=1